MSYTIRTSVAPDGEVHPLLVGADGLPIWWPNLWLLTKHRSCGAAYGTLATYGTFLCRLYTWAEGRGLPLEERFLRREWLEEWQLDSLADELSIQVRGVPPPKPWRKRPGNIEQFIAPKVSKTTLVSNETIATRLNIVSDYLHWLGMEGVNRAPFSGKKTHEGLLDKMIQNLVDKIPINHGHNKGLGRTYDREGVLRLLEVIAPGHPENPFRFPETQLRNHLIVMMLFTFGMRIGELGALQGKDIDNRAHVLAVARRPDDPEDPRGRYAMRQKTRARVMILELSDLITTYKKKVRDRHDQALNHPYLLVSEQGGQPISMAALEKVFRKLRENVSGLPEKLTPHYLRHAWNYEFSKVCEEKGIPKDEAEQLRKYLMGWKMGSHMHKLYDQPYIQERANECSLETQRRMFSMSHEALAAFERVKNLMDKVKNQGTMHV
jgi:integrase